MTNDNLKIMCVRENGDFDFDILDEVICSDIEEVYNHVKDKMKTDLCKNAIWIMKPYERTSEN